MICGYKNCLSRIEYKIAENHEFNIGDTVDVHVKIKEGNRERIQIFTGTVIKRQNSGLNETFTVRKISIIFP